MNRAKHYILSLIFIINIFILTPEELKYPFIYIPGMFDNGDMFMGDYGILKTLNEKEGFYYKNYFSEKYPFDKSSLVCSSNIIPKYERLSVANLIGDYRKNIPLKLMSDRLFAIMHGKAPRGKSFKLLTAHKGNNYFGYTEALGKKIKFTGLIEELWVKYGKTVYFKKSKNEYKVVLKPENELENFSNAGYYFSSPDEIKLNVIAHSSGGLAIRKYLALCDKENIPHHLNVIINLSVPQQGAKINYELRSAFSRLMEYSVDSFYNHKDDSIIEIDDGKKTYSYKELYEKTKVGLLNGDSVTAKTLRKIISLCIIYLVPFDGKSGVLGIDPALYDLHPDHSFIKTLNRTRIDKSIRIYNYRACSPHAKLFKLIGECAKLKKSDGIVEYDETALEHIPDYEDLIIKNIDMKKVNHIPLPYIKPLFELKETINTYYPFLKIIIKEKTDAPEEKNILLALISALMKEMGLEINNFLKNENYSVIDFFGDNPVKF